MSKFRKKPVVIEAERFDGLLSAEFERAICYCNGSGGLAHQPPHIHTLEGTMTVSAGDWIIKGVKGEFYNCKDEIFRLTYEAVRAVAHYPDGMGEESRRLHREYNALIAEQRNGAHNGPEVVRLTDECAAKGIILVPGGENL